MRDKQRGYCRLTRLHSYLSLPSRANTSRNVILHVQRDYIVCSCNLSHDGYSEFAFVMVSVDALYHTCVVLVVLSFRSSVLLRGGIVPPHITNVVYDRTITASNQTVLVVLAGRPHDQLTVIRSIDRHTHVTSTPISACMFGKLR